MRSRRFQHGQRRPQVEQGSRGAGIALTSWLLIGLIAGLVGSLYYAWIVDPVVYVDASPSRLSADFKEEYILMVSQSYAADGNWEKAQRRLHALADPNLSQTIAAQLESYLRRGETASTVRHLAVVAEKLGVQSAAVAIFAPTRVPQAETAEPTLDSVTAVPTLLPTPTPTRRPTETPPPTATPLPTITPSPTPVPIYRLLSQEQVCQRNAPAPRIEVVTLDALLEPLPGIAVHVNWDAGSDLFYTGFKPELGLGYGDFSMSPDVSYSVVLADGSPTVSGLRIELCDEAQGALPGGWRLTFQNTLVEQTGEEGSRGNSRTCKVAKLRTCKVADSQTWPLFKG